jgi:hypothetical protein
MGVVDVLVIPIHFAAAIPTTPSHYVNVISNDPCTKPPIIIPFTTTERRRLWITLRPVVDIAIKRRVPRDMVVLVMHVLKIFLVDSIIDNIPPCIWVMVLVVGTFPTSPTCFSRPCIEPLCLGFDHSMHCTNHPPPYLVDPMIPSPCIVHRRP